MKWKFSNHYFINVFTFFLKFDISGSQNLKYLKNLLGHEVQKVGDLT